MFIISADKYKISKGGIVTVYGVGFNESCKVRVSGVLYDVVDYSDEFICFYAPKNNGRYSFRIFDESSTSDDLTLYVDDYENLPTTKLQNRDEASFLRTLESLMPRGFAWNFGVGTNWRKFLSAVALGFAYLYETLKELVVQMSPYSTTSLGVFENELNLPRKGLEQKTFSGRKSEIVRISRKQGGATIPYLKSLVNLYGANFDLYEYWKNPEQFPAWVGNEGDKANFYLLLKVYAKEYYKYGFNCKSKCNEALGKQRDRILESILDGEKPAHVKIIYKYVIRALTDENGKVLTTDDGKVLIA